MVHLAIIRIEPMQTEYVVLLQLGEHRQGIFRLPAKAECGGCGALGWVASQAHIPASACAREVVRHVRISRGGVEGRGAALRT